MSKTKIFGITVLLGAILAIAVAESNWIMAAVIGASLVAVLWLFAHSYPRDAAPPADRRHENTMRRKAGLKPH